LLFIPNIVGCTVASFDAFLKVFIPLFTLFTVGALLAFVSLGVEFLSFFAGNAFSLVKIKDRLLLCAVSTLRASFLDIGSFKRTLSHIVMSDKIEKTGCIFIDSLISHNPVRGV
jgi:hypothetical protein